jgi:hydrogenase maturation protease
MTNDENASGGPLETMCVVGLGGAFGDDRVGWSVIDRLRALMARRRMGHVRLEIAATPADLLGIVRAEQRLIVVDACQGLGAVGTSTRLPWPNPRIHCTRHGWGHHVTLDDTLRIARSLGNLPEQCEIWCIEGTCFEFGQPLQPAVELAAGQVAEAIWNDYRFIHDA